MTTQTEALKIARTALGVQLDALLGKAGHLHNDDRRRYAENGIKAIDEALAQPEQEPDEVDIRSRLYQRIHELETQLTQIDQEPAAWIGHSGNLAYLKDSFMPSVQHLSKPLYTTPPQRKPLTDEEIILIVAECAASHQHTDIHFARAIERAHGIKELV